MSSGIICAPFSGKSVLRKATKDSLYSGNGKRPNFVKNLSNISSNGCACLTFFKERAEGALVYLNGADDLTAPLQRVEKAGGKVVMPKPDIGKNGLIAIFMDPEGYRVAFHSMN